MSEKAIKYLVMAATIAIVLLVYQRELRRSDASRNRVALRREAHFMVAWIVVLLALTAAQIVAVVP